MSTTDDSDFSLLRSVSMNISVLKGTLSCRVT